MNILKISLSILFFLAVSNILLAQKDNNVDKIKAIAAELPKAEQEELLKFSEYLLTRSKETAEEKQERIYKADNNMPTEATVKKIMEYSRYMTATQMTPKEQMDSDNIPSTIVRFKSQTMNFDKAKEGEVLQFTYHFTNTGKNPLYFYDVSAPCGCTVPEWSREPVAPGEKGEILVTFNTQSKKGMQTKLVKILSNTEPQEISLFIKGFIEENK